MIQKWLFILLITISASGLCKAEEFISLPKEYSFIPPDLRFGVWPAIFVDMLYILNSYPKENSLLLPEEEAKNIAIEKAIKTYPFLKPPAFFGVILKYLRNEQLPNQVFYYEVIFDGKFEVPIPLEGTKLVDPTK